MAHWSPWSSRSSRITAIGSSDMRTAWCIRCKAQVSILGGAWPATCPECKQDAHWSTEIVPLKDWVLNASDRTFMRSIKIAVDPEDDLHDGA